MQKGLVEGSGNGLGVDLGITWSRIIIDSVRGLEGKKKRLHSTESSMLNAELIPQY